jgi:hypothetical protein
MLALIFSPHVSAVWDWCGIAGARDLFGVAFHTQPAITSQFPANLFKYQNRHSIKDLVKTGWNFWLSDDILRDDMCYWGSARFFKEAHLVK